MKAFALVELAIALLCAMLAALHILFHFADRKDRVQLWMAIALMGPAFLNASLAGSGAATAGTLGWTIPWAALNVLDPLSWPGVVRMIFAVADDRPVQGVRRVPFWAALALAIVVAVGMVISIVAHLHEPMPTWEELNSTSPMKIGILAGPLLSGTALAETFLAWRRRGPSRWTLLWATIATGIISTTEGWREIHAPGQPALIGFIGLPLILLGSTTMIARFRAAIAGRDQQGGYRLIRRLGEGGMGELHLAVRTGAGGFERAVALKRVLADRGAKDADVEALLGEARTAAKLNHPNIVAVHDVGRLEKPEFGWFIAMEWLPGVDLDRVLDASRARRQPVPSAVVAAVGRDAARGLAHAHAHGVVHRDVSPHNLMLTFDGAVKLVDFGIASAAGFDPETPGMVVGKAAYIAPERLGGGSPTPASDLFSLGVTLYELLAGDRPFVAPNARETMRLIFEGVHRNVRERRPDVPLALADVVERALERERGLRWRDAASMAEALDRVVRELPPIDLGAWVRELCGDEWAAQKPFGRDEIQRTLSTMRLA